MLPEFDLTPEEWDVAVDCCANSLVQEVGQFDQDANSAVDVAKVLTAKLLGPRPVEPTPLQLVYDEIAKTREEMLGDIPFDKHAANVQGFLNALQFVRDNLLSMIGPEEK